MQKKSKLTLSIYILLAAVCRPVAADEFKIKSSYQGNLCTATMERYEQEMRFSRILNIGASFSKGCFTCDFNEDTREHLMDINEYGWVNRNYLIKFFKSGKWKNPQAFGGDNFTIVENDPRHDATKMVDGFDEKDEYLNVWNLDSSTNELTQYAEYEVEDLFLSDEFKNDSAIVGGVRKQFGEGHLDGHFYNGHLYQTRPGPWNGDGGSAKSIFDLSMDGSRSSDIFKYYGDKKLYEDLLQSGWRNRVKRNKLIKLVGERLAMTSPTLVVAVDALFWDSVPRFLSALNHSNGISPITKILTQKLIREKLLGQVVYPMEQEERMISDFMTLLSKLSTGHFGNKPVPVVVSRLIHNLGKEFEKPEVAQAFSGLLGQLIYSMLKVDLSEEITEELENFQRQDYLSSVNDAYLNGASPEPSSNGIIQWFSEKNC